MYKRQPVGGPIFDLNEYFHQVSVITFFIDNAHGVGRYFNGIDGDFVTPDDLYQDFGQDEGMISAALHYIENGVYPASVARLRSLPTHSKIMPYKEPLSMVIDDVFNYR